MSSTINTYTSNWFQVKDLDQIEEYVVRINETVEYINPNEELTIHHRNGQIRLTAFDMIDQSLGFYEDEEEEEWIDLESKIADMLEEGEVFRLSSISWFKGRLSHVNFSVYTWDGRQESRSLNDWDAEISKQLDLEKNCLDGWN